MAKEKKEMRHLSVSVTAEAADLLARLAGTPNKRGQYMTKLIMEAAKQEGLVDSPVSELTMQERLENLERQISELKRGLN